MVEKRDLERNSGFVAGLYFIFPLTNSRKTWQIFWELYRTAVDFEPYPQNSRDVLKTYFN